MLSLPTVGIARSVNKHNVELDVLCDWIEGSVLFFCHELSMTELEEALCDEHIYDDQDMASEITADAWAELERRQLCIGSSSPYEISSLRITRRVSSWRDIPAHSFCILLSLAKWYRAWARQFGSDYTEQGVLFEELTKHSLEAQFPDWLIHLTGWSRTKTAKLNAVVDDVSAKLGEMRGDVRRWTNPQANEAGLDILCYRPFSDGRVGIPVYLMQCASGGDWEQKLHMPRLETWTKIVQFAAKPRKAFATPFSFSDSLFIQNCSLVDGMLLDRYRLLSAAQSNPDWLPVALRRRIIRWARPRIAKLPRWDT